MVELRRFPVIVFIASSFLLAILWNPSAWHYLRDDFIGKDTIFNLTGKGQLGLVILTSLLLTFLLFLSLCKSRYVDHYATHSRADSYSRHLAPLIDLLFTVGLFVAAIAIVPQLHYVFYMQLITGLPLQWVASLPSYTEIKELISMSAVDSLNAMVSGLTFWSLIAGVLIYWIYRYTDTLDCGGRTIAGTVIVGAFSFCLNVFF